MHPTTHPPGSRAFGRDLGSDVAPQVLEPRAPKRAGPREPVSPSWDAARGRTQGDLHRDDRLQDNPLRGRARFMNDFAFSDAGWRIVGFALLALILSSCALDDDRQIPDVRVDAPSMDDAEPGDDHRCVVVGSVEPGAGGAVNLIDARTLRTRLDVVATHHDAVVRAIGDDVYVVNREGADGDNLQRLDPARGFGTRWQYGVGAGSNPWNLVALDETRGLLSLYRTGALLPVNLEPSSEAAFVAGNPIALPTTYDADGRAEPGPMIVVDGVVYVFLQGLDAYPWCESDSRGTVIAYDATTLERRDGLEHGDHIRLRACNPGSVALDDQGRAWVAMAGNARSLDGTGGRRTRSDDGGIEVLDLATGRSAGLVATESDLGDRDVFLIAAGAEGRLWVALADASFEVSVYRLFPEGAAGPVLSDAVYVSQSIFAIAEDRGRLWIADRNPRTPGVAVLDAATGVSLTDRPIPMAYPPFSLAFVTTESPCAP